MNNLNQQLNSEQLKDTLSSFFNYFNIDSQNISTQQLEQLKKNITELSFLFSSAEKENSINTTITKSFLSNSKTDSKLSIKLKLFYFENASLLLTDKEKLPLIESIKDEYLDVIKFKLRLNSFNDIKNELKTNEYSNTEKYNDFLNNVSIYIEEELKKGNLFDTKKHTQYINEINKNISKIDFLTEQYENYLLKIKSDKNKIALSDKLDQLLSLKAKCKTALLLDGKDLIEYWENQKRTVEEELSQH